MSRILTNPFAVIHQVSGMFAISYLWQSKVTAPSTLTWLLPKTGRNKFQIQKTSVTQDCEIAVELWQNLSQLEILPPHVDYYLDIHKAVYCQSAPAHANLAGNGWHSNKENENGLLHSFTMMQWNISINYFMSANSQCKSESPEKLKFVKYGSLLNQRHTSSRWD